MSRSKTINLGEVETLELVGRDDEQNVFSSLSGMYFNWTIEQQNQYGEFVQLRESNLEISEERFMIES